MKGKIQVIEGTYPVTVDEAVYITGTNKTLKDKLIEFSQNGSNSADFEKYIKKIKEATANLFNKDTVILYGYYDLNNNGAWYDDVTMCSSDFIEIEPGTNYTRSTKSGILETFYTKDKVFISGSRDGAFTTPSNAYYLKMAVKIETLESEMLVKGNQLPEDYVECVPGDLYRIPWQNFEVELRKECVFENNLSNELKSKIIEGDLERFEKALPKVHLQIETYYEGANEPYHPSVIKFSEKWNGYKYWMAYTPFPDEPNENPCIAASNDLIKWETPAGLVNPIDKPHDYSSGATGYWSDTHLVYNPNTDKLECWYRGIGASASGENNIVRKTSSNGVDWSEREVLFTFSGGSYVSPSIIFDENKYKIWFCRPSERYESENGANWSKVGEYSFSPINYNFWHQDIIKTDSGYELVGMESVGQNTRLIHFISDDGIKFKFGKEILKVLDNNKYNIKGFYKPCLVKENGLYYLFSSINWTNGTNGMSLSISDKLNDITSLKGIDQNYIPYMAKYTKKGKSAFEGETVFDNSLNKMVYCKRGGRNAEWVDFNGNKV
ncbi:hypothetical protein V1657_07075 [Clostridium perfringens]|uniref:hypothetical protein n=1 Tax=Clostridium perfringens TaxID=1502 RepID=UPI002ED280A7|nr:hypothetical protein V1657_07075 [Clostridium perfringens]